MAEDYPIAKQLYDLLPEVYRTKDENEDLKRYLGAFGNLMDQFRATLYQRLADSFPENEEGELQPQPWLIPYMAQLLDVRLRSPHIEGQRKEVAEAIHWRQRKGRLDILEDIAQLIAGTDAVVQEGWKRVVVTPRIHVPRPVPPNHPGDIDAWDTPYAQAYPVATIDMRKVSRAVGTDAGGAGGEEIVSQSYPDGAPCHEGRYDDVSRRIVDLRTPDWHRGRYHPHHLLVFLAPQSGFFPDAAIELDLDDINMAGKPLELLPPFDRAGLEIEDDIERKRVTIRNRSSRPIWISGKATFRNNVNYIIEGLTFTDQLSLSGGYFDLKYVAAPHVSVDLLGSIQNPPLRISNCLFEMVESLAGPIKMEYCTVLGGINSEILLASDCIIRGSINWLRAEVANQPITSLEGVGPATGNQLTLLGFSTLADLRDLRPDESGYAITRSKLWDIKIKSEIILSFRLSHSVFEPLLETSLWNVLSKSVSDLHLVFDVAEDDLVWLQSRLLPLLISFKDDILRNILLSDISNGSPSMDAALPIPQIMPSIGNEPCTTIKGVGDTIAGHLSDAGMNVLADIWQTDYRAIPTTMASMEWLSVKAKADIIREALICNRISMALPGWTVQDYFEQSDQSLTSLLADAGFGSKEQKCFLKSIRFLKMVTDRSSLEQLHLRDIAVPRSDTTCDLDYAGVIRYSSLSEDPVSLLTTYYALEHNAPLRAQPSFININFGQPGCGVLAPYAPDDICRGAEDGGEMGAYHDQFLHARPIAVGEKLKDFLPVGMESVLIHDDQLGQKLPRR